MSGPGSSPLEIGRQVWMGRMAFEGVNGVAQDYGEARPWFETAAMLGLMALHGLGEARDPGSRPNRYHEEAMGELPRITFNPRVMGGKPCIRGMRVTVSTVVGLVAADHTRAEILELYPYLEEEDIREALQYAAWRAGEVEIPLASA